MNRYLCLSRPPDIGCYPKHQDNPVQEKEYWAPARVSTSGRHYWGRLSYAKPLAANDVRGYNLTPESPTERANNIIAEKDHASALKSYQECDEETLLKFVRNDRLAWAILILRGHQQTTEKSIVTFSEETKCEPNR